MKTTRLNILSALVLGIFLWAAMASELFSDIQGELNNEVQIETNYLGNRTEQEVLRVSRDTIEYVRTLTGNFDQKGLWQGPSDFRDVAFSPDSLTVIERWGTLNRVNNKTHGKTLIYIKTTPPGNVTVDTICFHMGLTVDCEDFEKLRRNETSAYEIFVKRYPMELSEFNSLGYKNDYVENYMNRLQGIINSYPFDANEFDNYYEDAIDSVSTAPFDSLSRMNEDLVLLELLSLMDNATFRVAVFDRYLLGYDHTFEVLETIYTDYLDIMEQLDVSEMLLQDFCQTYDSLLGTYPPLDIEDERFPAQLDSQMYLAYNDIDSLENDDLINTKNTIALWSVLEFFLFADPVREAQREAYFRFHDEAMPALVSTIFKKNLADNRAEVEGFVINDGGAAIERRGMAWAKHNNPTVEDDTVHIDGELGLFSALITNLTPGETYFARAFARNAAGISYGNSSRFTAEELSSIEDIDDNQNSLSIHPNPASEQLNIRIEAVFEGMIHIQIVDVSGNTVLNTQRSHLSEHHQLQIAISGLSEGMYQCLLTDKEGNKALAAFAVLR